MSPKLSLALLFAATATLANGQTSNADSIRDSYHIFFPALGKDILAAHVGAHRYKIVNIHDGPAEVYIDDKKLPEEEVEKINDILQRIRNVGNCTCDGDKGDDQEVQQQREQSAEDRSMLKKGIQFLVEDHIIPNSHSLRTLVLTDSDIAVNGIKQSSDIYLQFRARLGDWAHNGFTYGSSGPAGYSLSINN